MLELDTRGRRWRADLAAGHAWMLFLETDMEVFSSPAFDGHEQVVFFYDADSGLKAIVALHDTTLGPALGGCRMWPYPSEAEALTDVLRLSKGMTYKAAMARLPYGGGKAVVIGDPASDKSEELFRALGRAIDSLGGRYYTGEDVGTSPNEMDWVGEETSYVLGRGHGGSGDPSPITARGVWLGIKAALRHKLGSGELSGIRVAIQGLGHVGTNLARLLKQDGAKLIVADIERARAERAAVEFDAEVVGCDDIFGTEAEVLAPCALGGAINDETLPRLACRIVAGAANNQLLEERHGTALHERGILYTPDYVINAGGLINIAQELRPGGYDRQRAIAQLSTIPTALDEVFERAEREVQPPHLIADRIAEERIRTARRARSAEPARPAPVAQALAS